MIQEFTRIGAAPDPTILASAITAALGAQIYTLSARVTDAGAVVLDIDKAATWLGTEITAVQTAINGAADTTSTRTLQAIADTLSPLNRAILFTMLDQINVIRAALPVPLGAISPAQAVAAVRVKIIT
jgi:hypothetical protein